MPVDVDSRSFESLVIEASRERPVVVDFWAAWCQPCLQLAPLLEALETESGGRWTLAKVDVQAAPELGQAFAISGIPALRAFRDGRVIAEITGLATREQLTHWLSGFVAGEELDHLEAARAAEQRSDDATARTEYERALELKPGWDEAVIGLAGVLERAGELEQAARLVEGLDGSAAARIRIERAAAEGPSLADARARLSEDDGTEARYRLAVAEAAAGLHVDALERLLDIVRTDRAHGDDAARKLMLDIFAVLGPDSEITDEYRRRLSMVLF